MLGLSALFIAQMSFITANNHLVDHSDQAISKADNLLKQFVDAETGVRGYVITGNEVFLEPFLSANESIDPQIHDLETFVSKRSEAVSRLEDISALYHRWLGFSESVIEKKRKHQDVTNIIRSEQDKNIMDDLRRRVADFVLIEGNLRKLRAEKAQETTRAVVYITLLTSLIVGVVLAFTGRKQLLDLSRTYEGALAIRDEFLGIASHELRTPLTSLKLHLQMMERNFRKDGVQSMTPDRVERMLKTSNRQIEILTHLIEDLMDVSRMTNGKLTLDPVNMDLVEMVKDVVEYFSEHLIAVGSKVEIRALSPVVGLWDRERVRQILVNLISNAIKYGSGLPIEIEVTHDERSAILKVIDHGIGIADQDQERIFERFERAVHGSDSISGLGLGLFIVREIVTAQGGTISVKSAPSKGSTFTVQLPLKRTAARSQP